MNSYRYHVTVEMTHDQKGEPVPDDTRSLHFEAANHDDLLEIAQRIRRTQYFDAKTAASLAIGFKLFSEVMLQHRNDPLFEGLREPVMEFVQRLKNLPAKSNSTSTPSAEPSAPAAAV